MSLAETFGLVGLNSTAFIALYDTQVESCTQAFREKFCQATANQVSDLIDDARVEAIAKFDVLNGRRPHVVHNSPENSLIMPAGGEDPEQETPEHHGLQQRLCAVVDDLRVDELSERMEASHRCGDKRCLHELRDPSVSHDWLWAINPAYGSHVPDEDYVTCVRLRLGAPIIDDAVVCHRCGAAILDRACSHALCCSLGEATKGHNKVRDDILRVVHMPTALPKLKFRVLFLMLHHSAPLTYSRRQPFRAVRRPWTSVLPLLTQQALATIAARQCTEQRWPGINNIFQGSRGVASGTSP